MHTCPICEQKEIRANHAMCWDCRMSLRRASARAAAHCVDCGTKLAAPYGDPQRCKPCEANLRRKRPLFCSDCGIPVRGRTGLCRSCAARRRAQRHGLTVQRLCSVEGCHRPHAAKGLCKNHYEHRRLAESGRASGSKSGWKYQLGRLPCALCDYDRMTSHLHRRVPALGYTPENVVPLCARCHEEVHRGLVSLS